MTNKQQVKAGFLSDKTITIILSDTIENLEGESQWSIQIGTLINDTFKAKASKDRTERHIGLGKFIEWLRECGVGIEELGKPWDVFYKNQEREFLVEDEEDFQDGIRRMGDWAEDLEKDVSLIMFLRKHIFPPEIYDCL